MLITPRLKLLSVSVILVLTLFHGLNNYFILNKSSYCLDTNGVTYFDHINKDFQAFKNINFTAKSLYDAYCVIFKLGFRPPLFFITASPFLLFGIDKNNVSMSNLIYFAILLFATYGIGKKLYNYKVGILSAFIVSMFPTIFALSRIINVDFALAAMVTLTFYLFTLNKFESLKFSLLTGIVVGLGALTKQTYLIFLLLIFLYFFSQKENLKNKLIKRNFVALVLLGSLIAAFYYINFAYQSQLVLYSNLFEKTHISPYFYLQSILTRQLLPVFSLLFLAGLIYSFKKKDYLLSVMILAPLIFFSMSTNKQDRFILPIFPLIAVIISAFICSLSRFKKLSVVILFLFSIFQYFIICYGDILPVSFDYLQKPKLALRKARINESGLFFITNEGIWLSQLEEIIKTLNTDFKKYATGKKMRILLITQDQRLNAAIKYSWIVKKMPFELQISAYEKPGENFDDQISRYDFIIIENEHLDNLLGRTKDRHETFKQNFNKFNCVKTELITFTSKKNTNKKSVALDNYMPEETTICLFKNKCLTD